VALLGVSHGGPEWVPILLGVVLLVLVALYRVVPTDSSTSKALAWPLTRQGQYDLSQARLIVVVVISIALIALGVALVSTGH
jgi:hypothetical protein